MSLPKLTAEQSLGAAQGVYINKVSPSVGDKLGVTTMMQETNISVLPPEIFFEIFSFMNRQSLLNFRATSKANFNLVRRFFATTVGKNWIQRNDLGTCIDFEEMFPIEFENETKRECCNNHGQQVEWRSYLTRMTYPCNNGIM